MTDRSQHLDPEERIKRLEARRAASSAAPRASRLHPAAKSRVLLVGLALAAFGVVGASMAATQAVSTSTVAAPAPVAQGEAPLVSYVPAPSPKAATSVKVVTRSAPVTRTRGS